MICGLVFQVHLLRPRPMSVSPWPSPRTLQLPLSSAAASLNPLRFLGSPNSQQCHHHHPQSRSRTPGAILASCLPCQVPAPSVLPSTVSHCSYLSVPPAPAPAQAWTSPCILTLAHPAHSPLCSLAPQPQFEALSSLVSPTPLAPSSLQEIFIAHPKLSWWPKHLRLCTPSFALCLSTVPHPCH